MADAEDAPIGKGAAREASNTIQRRRADVERHIADSVQSEAAQARSENAGGPKGVTADQAMKSKRIVDGITTFGSPISKQ